MESFYEPTTLSGHLEKLSTEFDLVINSFTKNLRGLNSDILDSCIQYRAELEILKKNETKNNFSKDLSTFLQKIETLRANEYFFQNLIKTIEKLKIYINQNKKQAEVFYEKNSSESSSIKGSLKDEITKSETKFLLKFQSLILELHKNEFIAIACAEELSKLDNIFLSLKIDHDIETIVNILSFIPANFPVNNPIHILHCEVVDAYILYKKTTSQPLWQKEKSEQTAQSTDLKSRIENFSSKLFIAKSQKQTPERANDSITQLAEQLVKNTLTNSPQSLISTLAELSKLLKSQEDMYECLELCANIYRLIGQKSYELDNSNKKQDNSNKKTLLLYSDGVWELREKFLKELNQLIEILTEKGQLKSDHEGLMALTSIYMSMQNKEIEMSEKIISERLKFIFLKFDVQHEISKIASALLNTFMAYVQEKDRQTSTFTSDTLREVRREEISGKSEITAISITTHNCEDLKIEHLKEGKQEIEYDELESSVKDYEFKKEKPFLTPLMNLLRLLQQDPGADINFQWNLNSKKKKHIDLPEAKINRLLTEEEIKEYIQALAFIPINYPSRADPLRQAYENAFEVYKHLFVSEIGLNATTLTGGGATDVSAEIKNLCDKLILIAKTKAELQKQCFEYLENIAKTISEGYIENILLFSTIGSAIPVSDIAVTCNEISNIIENKLGNDEEFVAVDNECIAYVKTLSENFDRSKIIPNIDREKYLNNRYNFKFTNVLPVISSSSGARQTVTEGAEEGVVQFPIKK